MSWEELVISKNAVSAVLYKRWIGCYMAYDWNLRHAVNAFYNNEADRYQKVAEQSGDDTKPPVSLTELYNKVLSEDIEDFIQQLMETAKQSRWETELEIAENVADLFEEHKGE